MTTNRQGTILWMWAGIPAAGCAVVDPVWGQDVVTTPLRTYGLGTLRSAEYAADGQLLITSRRNTTEVRLWHTETGELVRTLEGRTIEARQAFISPDATRAAAGTSGLTRPASKE